MVTINIKKRHLVLSIAIIFFLAGILIVVGVPQNPGHDTTEIDWSQTIPTINVNTINDNILNANTICLSGTCENSWPSSSSVPMTIVASTGLSSSISGTTQTLSLKTASSTEIGGIKSSVCGLSQVAIGVSPSGTILCEDRVNLVDSFYTQCTTGANQGNCLLPCGSDFVPEASTLQKITPPTTSWDNYCHYQSGGVSSTGSCAKKQGVVNYCGCGITCVRVS